MRDFASDEHLTEVFQNREELLQGKFLHALRDTVKLPNGKSAIREYFVHPGAVMIIPMLDDGRVIMERQFRYPVGQVMIEFPAGKLDPNEAVLACAQRELREETGYTATQWARAGVLHPVIAYSTEVIEIWFAKGLIPGARQLDEGEFLDVFEADPEELMTWCRDGKVTDAKTLTGVLWLQQVLLGAWDLEWFTPHSPPALSPPSGEREP